MYEVSPDGHVTLLPYVSNSTPRYNCKGERFGAKRPICPTTLQTTCADMATILSGKEVAADIRARVRSEIAEICSRHPNLQPQLAIIQVGNRGDSNAYIRMKRRAAEEVEVKLTHLKLPRSITETQLLREIDRLNKDPLVHGILLQLPLDTEEEGAIDSHKCTNRISAAKDVDGLTDSSLGRLAGGKGQCLAPCTPLGCLELIGRTGVEVAGKRAVVIGRSKIVVSLLRAVMNHNRHQQNTACVSDCHTRAVLIIFVYI